MVRIMEAECADRGSAQPWLHIWYHCGNQACDTGLLTELHPQQHHMHLQLHKACVCTLLPTQVPTLTLALLRIFATLSVPQQLGVGRAVRQSGFSSVSCSDCMQASKYTSCAPASESRGLTTGWSGNGHHTCPAPGGWQC